ncbi:hypothetical protein CWC11_18580 [Pseudoalteromonas sp. S3178]|uniref:hypothetical protein n=1 Tax=Pseudoalteromonas sp. S3178 TaxID=579532 RepID=UPI00110A84E5|nr:hypothetical protein [Pseudoalteromonas sp. S3178]TMP02374.1 hypothetical protein CWC11_18580 [Pseudoalteromonas sp. S3178]
MLKLKPHRYFQLLGLYGVLFLIPILQQQINDLSGLEDDYKRKQNEAVIQHMYYDVKQLVCKQLGQEATTHDCKKGIYQDMQLSFAIESEKKAAEDKAELLSKYWYIYYFIAIIGLIGNYLEYRKEYKDSIVSPQP